MARNSAARGAPPASANGSNGAAENRVVRCAIYTRKSTEEGLQQEFNSLDAQREAGEAFIVSQKTEGWQLIPDRFDDGGYTGGNMERPALQRLLAAVESRAVDCVVVYKVDRLSRSLMDFSRIVEGFDRNSVSFVAVTQQFNTTSSLGRLTLNILLSFAQFEREIISERTRDKMSAARRKGKWIGGHPVLGYDIDPKGGRLIVNPEEADQVRTLFKLYLELGSLLPVLRDMYEVALRDTPEGVRLFWQVKEDRQNWRKLREGSYMLRTNLKADTAEELWSQYVQLTEAEAAFRALKSELSIRPLFHQLEPRAKAHVMVAFLGYALWVTLKHLLKRRPPIVPKETSSGVDNVVPLSPMKAIALLATLQSADIVLPTTDGRELRLRRITEPSPEQKSLLHQLRISLPERFELNRKCSVDSAIA